MKKIVTILLIAMIAATGVFAAKAVDNPDYTFGGKTGWVRISGVDTVTFNTAVTHDVYTNNDFTVGVMFDTGLAVFVTEGARFTQYIGPTFTFKSVIPKTDIKMSAGAQFVDYTDFFDVGVGADLKITTWITDGCGVTFGGNVARLIASHTNMYGVYVGISCQL